MNISLHSVLSNVSPGTANMLAYLMLLVVAIFLIAGPTIYYIFSRKRKATEPTQPAGQT